jgi:hypothetical protein
MKRILTLALLCGSFSAFAQIDMGIPAAAGKGGTATAMIGNYECIGINPSALGWRDNYKFSFTVANVGMSAQSRALDLATLKSAITHPQDTFTQQQKHDLAVKFATPDGFNLNANINWFAASMYFPKFGGIAVNIRDRAYAHVTLNQNMADIMFNGFNASGYQDSSAYGSMMSTFLDGTRFTMLHYREVNIAYGRKLFGLGSKDADGVQPIEFFGGFGYKLLWGLGNIDVNIGDGTLGGHTSLTTTYKVDYGDIQNFTAEKTSSLFNAVGAGHAIDFAFSANINKNIRAAISFTDIGKIDWKDNVLLAADTLMPSLDTTESGINSWDLNSQASYFFDDFMKYGPSGVYTTPLPGKMRLGYGMKIGEKLNVGADIVFPINKTLYNLESPYFAIGGELKLTEWLKLNAGFSGNKQLGWNVPAGFIIGPIGFLEFGIATGDVLTYVAKSDNPNLSFAVGVIRFNFAAEGAAEAAQ